MIVIALMSITKSTPLKSDSDMGDDHGLIQAFNDGYKMGASYELSLDRQNLFSNDQYLEAVKSGFVQYLKDHPELHNEIKGFNHSYIISKNYPRLADKIAKTTKINPTYLQGFSAGKRELTNELVKGKDYWKKSKSLSQTQVPAKGRNKTR